MPGSPKRKRHIDNARDILAAIDAEIPSEKRELAIHVLFKEKS